MRKLLLTLLAGVLCLNLATAQDRVQRQMITKDYDRPVLEKMSRDFQVKAEAAKERAMELAKKYGWDVIRKNSDGTEDLLIAATADEIPIYFSLYNVDAARSTRADHLNSGGSLGLNLNGQGLTAHVWDGGPTRPTHQEFDGAGGNNRVTINDGQTSINGNSFHAMHVTGTIVASGVSANAKGMAPHAQALTHEWSNDLAEATTEAANGMLVSNHSYGFAWRNQFGQVQLPAWYGGAYIDDSRDWDALMYNAPYYLMVVAAGNDGNDNSANSDPLDGQSAYDKLTGHSTSKNNMVVANGQDANVNNDGSFNSVAINNSSSEGPTDDYRIKPDITGNGTSVYSTYESSDTAYGTISGTSMASPNVTGSLLLLQQHYNNLNSAFMRSATLKGVALHTADDAGISGPDAVFGWGLMNTKAAAEAISNNGNESLISELSLSQGQTYQTTVESDGINPLIVSICWTDPAGTANTGTANLSTPVLVNDLDIRVTKGGSTYTPYKLTGVNSNTQGDNNVDPYERVDVSGATGTYTITVTHKGSLSSGSQNFSLVATGLTGTPVVCNATVPTGLGASGITSNSATLSWDAVPGATYDVRYREIGGTWTTIAVAGNSTNLSGLTPNTNYEAQVRSKCDGGDTSAYSSSANFTTLEFSHTYCSSNGQSTVDEYIGRVQLGSIDNSSGAGSGGYTDHTNLSTNLEVGSSNTITVTPTWVGTVYSEGYSVWIDYNYDGDFADAGEQVWTQSATQATPVSGNFTVPAGANIGATTMRVSMKYNGIPTECESFSYGEVEDYTVNITTASGDTEAPTAPTNLVASNIQETTATLTWNASTDNVGVTGYNVYQGASNIGTVSGTSANLTGLVGNTNYTFSVTAVDAAGNESAASNSVNFTTSSGADTEAPTAPTNLTASNVTTSSADMSWTASTDNVGVTGYDVYVDGFLDGSTATTSYTVSGLGANQTYSISVRAKDAAGNESAATAINVTTDPAGGSVTLFSHFFESGWDGWIDGGSDCYRWSGSQSYEGNYSIRIRDNSGTASSMTSPTMNLSGYNQIDVEFYFYSQSMENGEDFWLRYYDGSSWSTVAAWVTGTHFNNGGFYTTTVTLTTSDVNFASNAQIRFQNDASVNNDRIFIDAVTVTASSGITSQSIAAAGNNPRLVGTLPQVASVDGPEVDFDSDMMFYPNPVQDVISFNSFDKITFVKIMGLNGSILKDVRLADGQKSLNVSDLDKGIYFIQMVTEEETTVEKFIKQ